MAPKRESSELAGMLRRMARALTRRAGDGDIEALIALIESRRAIDAAIKEAGAALGPDGYGHTWTTIAGELGITRQAAEKRFG